LTADIQQTTSYLKMVIDGFADIFVAADARDPREVNLPALTIVLRPIVEITAQVMWLLDRDISPDRRVRRYVIWRFHDLSQERRILNVTTDGHLDAIEADEAHLLERCERASLSARAYSEGPKGPKPAMLLADAEGDETTMPGYTELVDDMMKLSGLYSYLCVPTHGERFGYQRTTKASGVTDARGRQLVTMSGTALPANRAIRYAVLCLQNVVDRFAFWWCGLEDDLAFREQVARIEARATN
jgi:hypothetical protein